MRNSLAVNAGSDAGPAMPKETPEVSAEKQDDMEKWARDNLASTLAAVERLTRTLESPDVKGPERIAAKAERVGMLGRIKAMQRLLS